MAVSPFLFKLNSVKLLSTYPREGNATGYLERCQQVQKLDLSKTDRKQLQKLRYIREAEIANQPTSELRAIDKLWNDTSGGRFGFTAQCQVWSNCWDDELRAMYEVAEVRASCRQYKRFAEKVGWVGETDWLPYSGLRFDIDAPKGYLPAGPFYAEEIATGWTATLVEKLWDKKLCYCKICKQSSRENRF